VAKAIIDYVLDNYQRSGRRKVTDSSGATAKTQPEQVTATEKKEETFSEAVNRVRLSYL